MVRTPSRSAAQRLARPWSRPRTWLAAAAVVAAVATAGSLYLSLGLGFVPCDLCWYQRILMYPLVAVLGVAAVEDRPGVYRTALLLSVPGAAMATYHSYLQVAGGATCSLGGACSAVLLRVGGVFTIPNLSLIAFLLATAAVVAAVRTATLRA